LQSLGVQSVLSFLTSELKANHSMKTMNLHVEFPVHINESGSHYAR
jgi:hypothetical protein